MSTWRCRHDGWMGQVRPRAPARESRVHRTPLTHVVDSLIDADQDEEVDADEDGMQGVLGDTHGGD